MTKENVKMRPLCFSGVPVVCRHCGSVLYRDFYEKGPDGSYLCGTCFEKVKKVRK